MSDLRKQREAATLAIVLLYSLAPNLMAMAAELTPGQAYLQLFQKEKAAASYEDLLPLRCKRSIAKDKPMPDDEKKMMFELMKAVMPPQVRVLKEEIHGDEATVYADVPPDPAKKPDPQIKEQTKGVIVLVKEDGQWKIDTEKWDSKIESTKSF